MIKKEQLTKDHLEKAYNSFYSYRTNGVDYNHRYSSWDLCYKYFSEFFEKTEPTESDIKLAGLHLGFYLASWGMFRNSDLLNYGIKKYELLAKELYRLNKIDAEKAEAFKAKYDGLKLFLTRLIVDGIKENIKEINSLLNHFNVQNNLSALLEGIDILEITKECSSLRKDLDKYLKYNPDEKLQLGAKKLRKELVTTPRLTLITKIMLGVYANTPAIDRLFQKASKEYCKIRFYDADSAEVVLNKIKNILKFEINNDPEILIEGFIATKHKQLDKTVTEEKILDAVFFQLGKELQDNSKNNFSTT